MFVFFFKQNTAYEMRISDWSSDVCSSDLVWVLSDLAYSELYYDGCPTPSILQVPGAKDVAVEFTSMSKTYSMAGWRIGFAVAIGRASCRERVWPYVSIPVVVVSLKTNNTRTHHIRDNCYTIQQL